MRAKTFLVLLLVVALAMPACGDSGDGAAPTTPPTVTEPTEVPPTDTTTDTGPTTTTTIEVAPISYVDTGVSAILQAWDTSEFILVQDNPGPDGAILTRFAPSARNIVTTGLEADVAGAHWLQVELASDQLGWIRANHVVAQINEMAQVRAARWTVGELPIGEMLTVRRYPGDVHEIVASLERDATVQATGLRAEVAGEVWSQVVYEDGLAGWVQARHLIPVVVVLADDEPATYMVTGLEATHRLNVREGPGVHRDIVATLPGDAMNIESTGNRAEVIGSLWREIVLLDGETGWVNASYLRLQPPPPEPPPCNTGGDSYCPDMEVTRGMAAAFLARALELTDDGGKDWFTDDDRTTFEPEINLLAAAGILKGCDPDNGLLVCPDEVATRATVAALLDRALGLTDGGGTNWFTDDDGTVYEAEINRLAAAGIVSSCQPFTSEFCPEGPMLRGQIAAWLVRAFDLPAATQDYWEDDNGSTFEADINSITAAGIAYR
jgi:SH3-like domain-containing protein